MNPIRERALNVTIMASFVLVMAGLLYTQLIRYPYYSALSKNNSIRIIPIDAARGVIFDRNGVPLVTSRLSFNVAVIYQEVRLKERLIQLLTDALDVTREKARRALAQAAERPYAPVTIFEDIDKEKAFYLEEASFDVDGLIIETRSRRHYRFNDVGSHIFGYLGEVSEEELEALRDYGYRPKDLVGRAGLEKYYDRYLRGTNGGMQIQVDNKGRERKVLGLKEPSSGEDIYLTIDIRLQEACDKLLGSHAGAIIAMDGRDGSILALASHPSFDPNIFVQAASSPERMRLIKDKTGRPLSNRAISGLYPPGSVFKVVTASAGLESKRISPNTHFFCPGYYTLGPARFDCWKEGGHGSQEVTGGLINSCNVFFYSTGRATGPDNIENHAKLFGFGRPTGIDLPDEVAGLVPGRMWKRLTKGAAWYEGETLNYAIGQGYLLVTPIQILQMMTAMANSGKLVKPYLVKAIGPILIASVRQKNIGLKDRTVQKVREGLYKVVEAEGGTGRRAGVEGLAVAGKTGTAQNPHGKTHAWFSGFAPYKDAKMTVVVFLEHGGKGGLEPAEMAKGMFEEAKRIGYLL